ncbi:MAG: hypothetical protein R3A46_08730 [Thermomicrobiales bacterium]
MISTRRILALLTIAALLASCSADDIQFGDEEPSPTATAAPVQSLDVDGDRRTYQQFIPEGPAPGDGWPRDCRPRSRLECRRVRSLTGFDELAAEEGFIAVYPDGLACAWPDAGIGSAFTDTDIASLNLISWTT